jgi:chemosensory pili system protein ChpA (sensor histidine kinase/response regulator)
VQAKMSDIHHSETPEDLSTLVWVQDELRRSLEAAHKALRRFVKESESSSAADLDTVDPVVLRTAHQQIHQGVGALELVGLPIIAGVLRASEAAVKRFVLKPQKLTANDVDVIEQASFALLDYLQRLLCGKYTPALALFPCYRAVSVVAAAERIHPADLWAFDWRWREVASQPGVPPLAAGTVSRTAMEPLMLLLMRDQTMPAAQQMGSLCAGLGAGASDLPASTLWKLSAGFFESLACGSLQSDVFTKRVASRLLAQLRIFERGEREVAERLAQDLLFFCAQSGKPAAAQGAPCLNAVWVAYELSGYEPVNYEVSSLGRFDPASIAQAKKRVSSAKDAWSSVAGGEMHRMAGLSEQFALVADSVKRLYPGGELLAQELTQAVAHTQQSAAAPSTSLAMEVATSILYLESSLEDADFDHPEQAKRVRRLAQRIANVRAGHTADPLEAWMEELYRRVSDRQTMGSVVQELRASLNEIEKQIDQYFRNPAVVDVILPVPNQLASMRGVLSVLGMDQATQALARMRDDVDGLIQLGADAPATERATSVDRLAGNLGALGFLIDMLAAQPHVAKSLFVFDVKSGALSPLMGRSAAARQATNLNVVPAIEPHLIEQAQAISITAVSDHMPLDELSRDLERLYSDAKIADQPDLAATVVAAQEAIENASSVVQVQEAREQLSEAMVEFVHTASEPVALEQLPFVEPPPLVTGPTSQATDLADDPEMREIFLEEAREKVDEAREALVQLTKAPDDIELLTTVRRAFHTFKGSSRMVGLKEFGDAAWSCEQLYNTWLAEQQPASGELLEFSNLALDYLDRWIEAIAAMSSGSFQAAPLVDAAAAFGRGEKVRSISPLNAAAPAALATPSAPFVPSVYAPLPNLTPPPSSQHGKLKDSVFDAPALPVFDFDLNLDSRSGLDLDLSEFDRLIEAPKEAALDIDLALEHSPSVSAELAPLVPIDTFAQSLDLPETTQMPSAFLVDTPMAKESVSGTPLHTEAPSGMQAVWGSHADFSEEKPEENPVKVVGPLRISIPLFNIYLNEADELSRKLTTEVAEWGMELHRPVGETSVALAHSLAGSSATVGFADLSHLARLLEHALMRSQAIGSGTFDEGRLFVESAEEIRRLLNQFAAGFLWAPAPALLERLAEHEISSARRLEERNAVIDAQPLDASDSESSALLMGSNTSMNAVLDVTPDVPVQDTRHGEVQALPEAVDPVVSAPQALDAPPTTTGFSGATVFGSASGPIELGLPELKEFTPMAAHTAVTSSSVRSDDHGFDAPEGDDEIDAVDAVDAELFPIFEEEAQELLPQLDASLRDWAAEPSDNTHASACMRTLHTLKGGARLAGAMRLGEMAHRLETAIEILLSQASVSTADIDQLQTRSDGLGTTFEAVRSRDAKAYAAEAARVVQTPPPAVSTKHAPLTGAAPALPVVPMPALPVLQAAPLVIPAHLPAAEIPKVIEAEKAKAVPAQPMTRVVTEIDWSRFVAAEKSELIDSHMPTANAANSSIRVRGPLLERMVNQAGEVSITRSRIEVEVGNMRTSLKDLTENLERLRQQLRDIEFQAETQMLSRQEAAKAAHEVFDPLESDRFTRFQEITRMMAESVNDVATVQRSLQRMLETTEDELAAQARLTRDLQDDLLRTRMVEFDSLSDRLYRVVRQAAKEMGKQVRLDIVGGSIEIDRGVLDRMTPAFEHLLRNCVTHGIETAEARTAAGKDAAGTVVVVLRQDGNEVGVEFRDDGAGLNLARIREKGLRMKLLQTSQDYTDADLANLIFTPGFSTADTVTELAGRGVGMDVVRSEVNAMGGRIETATATGQGTSFKLVLPLTTAVTQVVMIRCGTTVVAVPATLIEIVRRATLAELEQSYNTGSYNFADRSLLFFWFGSLLQQSPTSNETSGRSSTVVIARSAQQRIVLHVDEVLGTQEAVVKNLGPQLSRLPGLAGMTLLASGAVALIYNPVALATLYGDAARTATAAARAAPVQPTLPTAQESNLRAAPLVLVVDDSLTVRRVTQRLLVREGFRVTLAKDGIDALEKLADERPQVVLSDIEMPRMDGFDLARNIRGDARWRDLPIIMITSRIAQKHRDHAAELGVDHYLGKPYSEEDLLALIARYTLAAGSVD